MPWARSGFTGIEADAHFLTFRRTQMLAFGRRNAARIDIAACVAEDAELNVADVDFGKIHAAGLPFLRRGFLEKEHLEEAPVAPLRTYSASALRSFTNSR